eukprot:3299824-Pyramimonas_sp.AAC.1
MVLLRVPLHAPLHNRRTYGNYNASCTATPSTRLSNTVSAPGSHYFLLKVVLRWHLPRPSSRMGTTTMTP